MVRVLSSHTPFCHYAKGRRKAPFLCLAATAAASQAKHVSQTAEEGGEVMNEVNHAMEQTEVQASELDHIVAVFTLDGARRSQAA